MESTARGGSLIVAGGLALLLSLTSYGGASSVSAAAPADPILDVELEADSVPAGSTVTLTAWVFDDAGQPLTGPGSNTSVRFYFATGSANDPGGNGNNADMQCHTGQAGTCAVSYVPANQGIDTICARTSNGPEDCGEPVDAPERLDSMDTVRRTVTEPAPSPDGSPLPTPAPSVDPSPTPSDAPTPAPGGSPSPSPDGAGAPDGSPAPSPSPSPESTPAPSPSVDPSPVPADSPAPAPGGSPSPSPIGSPAPTDQPSPSPSPDPTPSPSPSPSPSPEPTPAPSPSQDPAPSGGPSDPPGKPDDTPGGGPKASVEPSGDPTPTPSPDPTPTPSPDPTPTPEPSATPAEAPSPSPSADPSMEPSTGPSMDTLGDPFSAALPPEDRGGDGDPSGGRTGGTDGTPAAAIPPGRSPSQDFGGVVDAIVSSAVDGVSTVLVPEAAATVATSFGFPIALALVVMLFLALQSRMDDRDPKIRSAPRSMADTLVAFEDDRG